MSRRNHNFQAKRHGDATITGVLPHRRCQNLNIIKTTQGPRNYCKFAFHGKTIEIPKQDTRRQVGVYGTRSIGRTSHFPKVSFLYPSSTIYSQYHDAALFSLFLHIGTTVRSF